MDNFTKNRIKILNKMNFPNFQLPLNLKFIWNETVDAFAIENNITKEIHEHSFNEIHFVICGNISYYIDDKVFTAQKGEAFIIPSNKKHKFISCSDDIVKNAIAFSCDQSVFESFGIITINEKITQRLNNIFELCEENNIFIPHLIAGEMTEILYSVIKILSIPLPESDQANHDPRFLAAKSFIENNIDKRIAITQVANECCLSTKQLNRIFQKEMGSSVSDYINLVRINLSRKLLIESDLSIKEISFAVGFENTSSFILFFKKHCFVTPGDFKIQMSRK